MLSSTLVKALNKQVNLEFYSSNIYRQISAWCAHKGLPGCAGFLRRQAGEEMEHMSKLFNYLIETGTLPTLGEIKAPEAQFTSIEVIFKGALEHEQLVTRSINSLVETALKEKDFSTFNFLQWYVAEQHEEEGLFRSILDKIKLIGTDGRGLFFFDREIGALRTAKAA